MVSSASRSQEPYICYSKTATTKLLLDTTAAKNARVWRWDYPKIQKPRNLLQYER